jgi:excisionase family DNA binding protein
MDHAEVRLVHERLLTVGEVAERLQVPRTWVYRHLATIPHVKLGKYVRIEPSELESLLRVLRRRPRES